MDTVGLSCAQKCFEVCFESVSFSNRFQAVFKMCLQDRCDGAIRLVITGEETHDVFLDGMLLQSGLSSESVVYLLTLVFNEAIRGSVSEAICSIHASSCSIDGVAISFVGDRGAGKSSLALLMSEYGKYLGDEYAFGDLNNGTLWHQLYPVSIKESGRHLFPSVDFDDALRLTDETQVISYLLPYEHILSQSTISRYSCDSPLFDQPPGLTRPSSGSSYSHSTIQQQNTLQ